MKDSKNVVANMFSQFCYFSEKEATSNKQKDESETKYVTGVLNEVYIPQSIYKIISDCHNTIVGRYGFHRTCKTIEDYLRNNVVKADNCQRLTQS